jgi:hypothetical protein
MKHYKLMNEQTRAHMKLKGEPKAQSEWPAGSGKSVSAPIQHREASPARTEPSHWGPVHLFLGTCT